MQKNKIVISIISSLDTINLAQLLKKNLEVGTFVARIWVEERERFSRTIIEMLHEIKTVYDFALVILTRDDESFNSDKHKQQARGNCFYETGLFMGALGRDRCFLVSSVRKSELPSDLLGLNFLSFKEPEDLANDDQCKQALDEASTSILGLIKERGGIIREKSPPFLSFAKILAKERMEGGNLKKLNQENQERSVVVVCDTLPIEDFSWTIQIKENLDKGIRYFYFFHAEEDNAQRICRLREMILLADF